MSIKKTYIPAKPRSSKLVGTSMSGGVAGSVSSSSTGSTDPNSHSHLNKRVLDTITQEMLDNTLREILGVDSTEEATDENFFSALRTLAEIIKNNETLKDLFLSKLEADTAEGKITFEQGLVSQALTKLVDTQFGDFQSGMVGGSGAQLSVNEYGRTKLEVDEIEARDKLIVPKITFNNIDVISGDQASTFAYGTIKAVDTENKIAELDLLDGEYGTLKTGDILRGVFHNINGGNYKQDAYDTNGFLNYSGFATSYFTPTKILTNEPGKMVFQYELQGGTDIPPVKGMNFFAYGNFTDKERQSITYTNRLYTRRIMGVNKWTIIPNEHIKMQDGLIEGLSIGGMNMKGVGAYMTNLYIDGSFIIFTPQQLEELKGESAYSVHLSQSEFTINIDSDGNIIGGLYEDRIVTTDNKVTTTQNKIITVPVFKLSSLIQAFYGTDPLYYSEQYKPGTFMVGLRAVGCTAKIEAGRVMITGVISTKEAYIELSINCAGDVSFVRIININFAISGKDGKDGIGKDGFSEVTLYKASRLSPSVLPSRTLLPKTDSLQEPYYSFMNYWSYGMPTNLMLSLEFEDGNKQFEQDGFVITGRDHGINYKFNSVRIKFITKVKNQKIPILYTHSKSSSSSYTNSASLKLDGVVKKSSTGSLIETLELIAENIGEHIITLSFSSAGEKNSDFFKIQFLNPDFEELPIWETKARVVEHFDGTNLYFNHYSSTNKYSTPQKYIPDVPKYELQSDVKVIGTNSLGGLEPSAFLVKQMLVKRAGSAMTASYYMTAFYSKDGKEYSVIKGFESKQIESINVNLTTVAESKFAAIVLTDAPVTALPATYIDKLTVPVVRDGENVASSSVPVNCGEYDPQRRYYWNKNRRDIVLFTQEGHTDVYMANVFSEDGFIGKAPTDKEHWLLGSKSMFMAIGTLLVDDADFAGFKIKSEKIISQSGRDDKNNQIEYKDVADFSKFTPNTSIDGKSGQIRTRELIATGFFASPFVEVSSQEDFDRVDSLNWILTKKITGIGAMFRLERYNGAEISIFNASNVSMDIDVNLVQLEGGVWTPGVGNTVRIPSGRLFKARCVKLLHDKLGSKIAWYITCPHRLVGGAYEIMNYEH